MKNIMITSFAISLAVGNLTFADNLPNQAPSTLPSAQNPTAQTPALPANPSAQPSAPSTDQNSSVPSTMPPAQPTTTPPPSAQPSTASSTQPAAQWQTYNYNENGFTVSLPLQPEHTHQDLALPNSQLKIPYDIYVSDPNDKESFLVGVAQYPTEINVSTPENNLKAAVNGTLGSTPGGQLYTSEMSTYVNYPAIDFTIEGSNYNMKGRYILVGHTLYQLMVAYDKSMNIDPDYQVFLNSFKLSR